MDKHLNIFRFFNNNQTELYEDNLSRAFALCLKFDTVFLDNILKKVLDTDCYRELFAAEYPSYSINIDLQRRTSDFGSFSRIFAIACSSTDFQNDLQNIEQIDANRCK